MKKLILCLIVAGSCSGCLQVIGANHIDAWGLKMDANNGFEVSAGVMQYNQADNRKGTKPTKGGDK